MISVWTKGWGRASGVMLWSFALIAAGFGIVALSEWRADTLATAQTRSFEVARLEASIRELNLELHQLRSADISNLVWRGARPGELTALVQARVGEIAASHGLQLRSITPIQGTPLPLTESLAFRVEIEAPLDRYAAFLRQVEFHSPAILVQRAIIRRVTRFGELVEQPIVNSQLEILVPAHFEEAAE